MYIAYFERTYFMDGPLLRITKPKVGLRKPKSENMKVKRKPIEEIDKFTCFALVF